MPEKDLYPLRASANKPRIVHTATGVVTESQISVLAAVPAAQSSEFLLTVRH